LSLLADSRNWKQYRRLLSARRLVKSSPNEAAELLELAAESAPGDGREDFVVLAVFYDRLAATVTVRASNDCGQA
jgi:hypothetical protein